MPARFKVEQVGDVTVIDAEGRITLGEGSTYLRELIKTEVNKGGRKFILNVGGVNYIDSSGVGEMVSGSNAVNRHGGEIKLVALNKRVRDLLTITTLYKNFDIHDETAHAIRCFGGQHIGCSNR